ncbi:ABC transporter substrate-binding protein [Mycobacterium sp. SMC-4]|uniref:ABC transporter substrate-binding protein n=1 Tax=Mycobacterium sp. SMC-4 TaxID=2857059 RepID=UPI003D022734
MKISTRRGMFRAASFAACVALSGALVACSSDDGGSATVEAGPSTVTDNALLEKYGVGIPQEVVNIGMMPYADNMMLSIGMAKNWFEEVGIDVGPDKFSSISDEQQIPLTLNGDYDVVAAYGPNMVRNTEGAPSIKIFNFIDVTSGLAILAAPGSGKSSVADLMGDGMNFQDAVTRVMNDMKGSRFATDDIGAHRSFLDAIYEISGFSQSDFGNVAVVDDSQTLLLAGGGQLDYAKPIGAVQTAELIEDGWYPVIGLQDLIENLPAGDPRAVSGLGHVGHAADEKWIEENHDTMLRVSSVAFRIVDAVLADINNGTTDAIDALVPVIESAASVDTSADALRIVFEEIGPFASFEDQADWWVNTESPYYYKATYNQQIQAARDAGVIKNADLDASDFIVADDVYSELVQYKQQYEALLPEAQALTGDQAKLAELAAAQYAHRNYLDASRILQAAVK